MYSSYPLNSEENIKGLDIIQHMPLQQKIHGITSLLHSNMGKENGSTEIPSYFHPSPLHPKCCSMKVAQFERHSRCTKPLLETCRI
jgi:hypothetical protein